MSDQPQDTRAFRVVRPEEQQPAPILAPGLMPGFVTELTRNLPPWGKIVVLASLGVGLGGGLGIASIVRLLGIQTVAAATLDKEELRKDIGGVVRQIQASNEVQAEARSTDGKRFDAIDKTTSRIDSRVAGLAKLLGKRAALPPSPPAPSTPPAKEPG